MKKKSVSRKPASTPWHVACSVATWTIEEIKLAAGCAVLQAAFELGMPVPQPDDVLNKTMPEKLAEHTLQILDRWAIPVPERFRRTTSGEGGDDPCLETPAGTPAKIVH